MQKGLKSLLAYLKEEGDPHDGGHRFQPRPCSELSGAHRSAGIFPICAGRGSGAGGETGSEIYLKACAMLRLDPAEVLVLEDSWNGVRSAHSAGAPVILIPDLQKDTGPVEGPVPA